MGGPYDIDTLLEDVITLPSLPSSVIRVTELIEDPDSSLTDVAEAMSSDPALTMKVLRLVNSAFYGVRSQIASLDQAVSMLGMKVVRNVVLTASVFESLQSGIDGVLQHSVACGIAMGELCKPHINELPIETPQEGFIFGLLHDSGKIIIEQFLPEDFAAVLTASRVSGRPWHSAEKEILGIDHAEVGAHLAQQWKLPLPLVSAVNGHHDLARCENEETRKLAGLLSIANHLAFQAGFAIPDVPESGIPEDAWPATGIAPDALPGLAEAFSEQIPAIEELMRAAG